MSGVATALREISVSGLLGLLCIGLGGRIVMRLLTILDGRSPGFSWGGTIEIALYGLIIGLAAGLAWQAAKRVAPSNRITGGAIWGLLIYAATIITLPSHIAETAAPFREHMTIVYVAFGFCFLAFGLSFSRFVVTP